MRILKINIKDENSILNNFIWSSDKTVNIFIGENGSGKSTLLKNLLLIFKGAFEFFVEGKNASSRPQFKFEIIYEIIINNRIDTFEFETNYTTVRLSGDPSNKKFWSLSTDNNKYSLNDIIEKFGYQSLFPENIIAYYAGWNDNVKNIFLNVENEYKERAIKEYKSRLTSKESAFTKTDRLPLIYIDKPHFDILLAVLFSFEFSVPIDNYLLDKFKIIKEEKSVICIFLKKPDEKFYNNNSEEFWGARGELQNFLVMMREFSSNKDNYIDSNNEISLIFDLEGWYRLREYYATENRLYLFLHLLNSSGFLNKIQIFFNKNGKSICNYHLSEGEQQLITIKGIKELLIQNNSLLLFDEPDTFLHPKWQQDFIEELTLSLNYNRNVELPFHNEPCIFITTHSLNLLNNSNNEISSVTILQNGKVSKKAFDFYGKTIRAINYDLMGVEERPEVVKNIIDNLYALVEKEMIEIANIELQKLIDIVGENDEDVIRLKAEIDFIRTIQNDKNP